MAHLHTQPGEHDLTVSAYIVRRDSQDEPRLLLHRHRKLNKLMQIGGHVEVTETPWQALAHEIAEESGYQLHQLQVLQPPVKPLVDLPGTATHPLPVHVGTHPFQILQDHWHTDLAFAFVTDEAPQGLPRDGESQDLTWLARAAMEALTDQETIPDVQVIGLYVLDECLPHWQPRPTTDYAG